MAKKSMGMNVLIVFFILIAIAVYMANQWLKEEVDNAIDVPSVVIKMEKKDTKKKLKTKSKGITPMIDVSAEEIEVAPNVEPIVDQSKQKKVKEIYEIPLDDVILVQ